MCHVLDELNYLNKNAITCGIAIYIGNLSVIVSTLDAISVHHLHETRTCIPPVVSLSSPTYFSMTATPDPVTTICILLLKDYIAHNILISVHNMLTALLLMTIATTASWMN